MPFVGAALAVLRLLGRLLPLLPGGRRVSDQLLGPRAQTGIADPQNMLAAGNWTVTFAPKSLQFSMPLAEVYHIAVKGPGGFFEVFINEDFWDTSDFGGNNSWDPAQPMLIRPGDTVFFFWSLSGGTAPQVTLWLRSKT